MLAAAPDTLSTLPSRLGGWWLASVAGAATTLAFEFTATPLGPAGSPRAEAFRLGSRDLGGHQHVETPSLQKAPVWRPPARPGLGAIADKEPGTVRMRWVAEHLTHLETHAAEFSGAASRLADQATLPWWK